MSDTRWPTATKSKPCPICGHTRGCRIAPDGTAAVCWHDGHAGKVIQCGTTTNGHAGAKNLNGTSIYTGAAHRPKPAAVGKAFDTAEDAIAAAGRGVTGGTLASVWSYTGASGAAAMCVARFNTDGGKEFRPVHRTTAGWKIGDPPGPLPLYRLADIPADGMVWVCEGEKATDAARSLGLAAVTSAHGAASAAKSDWTPLAGRDVVILPDDDDAGRKYAREVAVILAKLDPPARAKVVALPGLPDGGDIVEYIADHDGTDTAAIATDIIALADAVPFIPPADLIGGIVTRCLADVQTEEIAWLWRDRFALGKLSLIGGVPGVGKSWLSLYISAAISRAMPWPDGRGNAPLGTALIANAEDGAADTIKPRLEAMGADCRQIHVLDCVQHPGENGKIIEHGFTLAHITDLEDAIKRIRPLAIVIDPVSAFLADADEHRNGEVRALLKPLARLAEKYGIAIILITHLTKNGGANSVHRMIGSIAFAGAARSVWMVAKDPKNPDRRLLLLAKCNIAADAGGLAYSIVDGSIAWEAGAVTESADDVLAAENAGDNDDDGKPGPEPAARTAAREWLSAELSDMGEHPVPTLRENARAAGLGWRTVERASAELGVRSHRASFGGGYVWRLPRPGTAVDDPPMPATMLATPQENESTWQPGEQAKTNGKTEHSARQVPLPAMSVSLGEHGAIDDYEIEERLAIQQFGG